MRKGYILLMIAALLIILCVPAAASYEEDLIMFTVPEEGVLQGGAFTGPQTVPGEVHLMDSSTDALYSRILQALQSFSDSVSLEDFQTKDTDWVKTTFQTVVNDHPELFYADWFTLWGYTDRYTRMELKYYDLSYYGYSSLEQAVSAFDAGLSRALSVVEAGMSDLEKALALHDYLVLNCAYNWDVAVTKDFSAYWAATPNKMLATAFGALVNGDPICQAYSLAYKLLLNRAGIDCVTIGSDAMNHMWNGVKLDGNWYQVDVTWDDPVPNTEGMCRHTYFLLSDATFGNGNKHYGWEQKVTCGSAAYESGWIFNGSNHAIYRRDGQFYYTQNNRNLVRLHRSAALSGTSSEVVCGNTGASFYYGLVWHDKYVYLTLYAPDSDAGRRLVRCNLDTGTIAQLGGFSFAASPSPDGAYSLSSDHPGMRYNADTGKIEIVSSTRLTVDGSLALPPDTSGWEAQAASAAAPSIAGLTEDRGTAGVLLGNSVLQTDLSFMAAFYRNGKMVAMRLCTIPKTNNSYGMQKPAMELVAVEQRGLPAYDAIRLMLVDADSLRPVCKAA